MCDQTLSISLSNAKAAYGKGDSSNKRLLEELFPKYFTGNIRDRVKTLEDACMEIGKQPSTNPDAYKRAEENIEIFAEALRGGKPAKECLYYPYFIRSSGGGFSFDAFVGARVCSDVGARLRVATTEDARHLGECMIEHYKIMDQG